MPSLHVSSQRLDKLRTFTEQHAVMIIIVILATISVISFIYFYANGLGLAYNDARSHLNIGRRVVEGLKPGLAQLGSVWLPLTHLLMVPTIWNDFMWHSGLSGAIQSMVAFVLTGVLIYRYLERLRVDVVSRFIGVAIFVFNINILYLQSTAMTELLLLATMTAGAYYILVWYQDKELLRLLQAALWIAASTLVRYDGWFLLMFASLFIGWEALRRKGYAAAEGSVVLFSSLAGFGILLWLLWNQLIFKDALYFIFGPYSAYAQQQLLESAGILATKGNFIFSIKTYWYALSYNSNAFIVLLGILGAVMLWMSRKLSWSTRSATIILIAPFIFNVIALYLGHSVLFIQGLTGESLFNVRYGIMLMPSLAIFIGYLLHRIHHVRPMLVGMMILVLGFQFINADAVTIDDARIGASQKNVTEVSSWLADHAQQEPGYILISAASHDAIVFSSGLPMSRFIHEGTGIYWDQATQYPELWARWIVMRTYSEDDATYRLLKNTPGFKLYKLVGQYPFADIYELPDEFVPNLNTQELFSDQK